MAVQHHNSSVPFLVFPTSSSIFTWQIRATETNRLISRHKRLDNAIRKAERLNDLSRCVYEERWDETQGFSCEEVGTIYDPESEGKLCAKHARIGVDRG